MLKIFGYIDIWFVKQDIQKWLKPGGFEPQIFNEFSWEV